MTMSVGNADDIRAIAKANVLQRMRGAFLRKLIFSAFIIICYLIHKENAL